MSGTHLAVVCRAFIHDTWSGVSHSYTSSIRTSIRSYLSERSVRRYAETRSLQRSTSSRRDVSRFQAVRILLSETPYDCLAHMSRRGEIAPRSANSLKRTDSPRFDLSRNRLGWRNRASVLERDKLYSKGGYSSLVLHVYCTLRVRTKWRTLYSAFRKLWTARFAQIGCLVRRIEYSPSLDPTGRRTSDRKLARISHGAASNHTACDTDLAHYRIACKSRNSPR